MAQISLKSVSVDLPIYGSAARSLKSRILLSAIGGRLAKREGTPFVRALSDVNLEIRSGERVGLWGHNGAGKTTLLRVFAGALTPTSGKALISGRATSLIDITLGLEDEATGYENIVLRGLLMGLSPRQARRLVPAVTEFSELGDFLALPVRTYSSGMRLRLAFAVSTAIDPEILLMDEWLSVGDAAFSIRAEQRLAELIGRAKILVIASHDRSLLERVCDRVVELEHGRITRSIDLRPSVPFRPPGEMNDHAHYTAALTQTSTKNALSGQSSC